jgi:hypothetical protein
MNRIRAIVLGASVLMVATAASGRARSPEVPSASQATPTQSAPGVTESSAPQSAPLFTFRGMTVYLWAPVEPTYDADMNRNSAADPMWEWGMAPAQGDFKR